jgi:hypothetical protein
MGLLVVRITDEYDVRGLLAGCAIIAMIAAVLLSSYWRGANVELGRHLISIPFLWLGLVLSKRPIALKFSIMLIIVGMTVQVIEAVFIHRYVGKVLWDCPLLFGTIPFTLGIFGVASNLQTTPFLETVGRLGSRYTGCIFITHVYFIWLASHLAKIFGVENTTAYCLLIVPVVFALNLMALKSIDRMMPLAIDTLLGDKAAIQHLATKFTPTRKRTSPIADAVVRAVAPGKVQT